MSGIIELALDGPVSSHSSFFGHKVNTNRHHSTDIRPGVKHRTTVQRIEDQAAETRLDQLFDSLPSSRLIRDMLLSPWISPRAAAAITLPIPSFGGI